MEFNEEAAIEYIRKQLPSNSQERFDDDEILNVIDIIWDYYDENGFLEIESDPDDEDVLDMDDLLAYVKKVLAKDRNCPLSTSDVEAIVKAELDYEDTLED